MNTMLPGQTSPRRFQYFRHWLALAVLFITSMTAVAQPPEAEQAFRDGAYADAIRLAREALTNDAGDQNAAALLGEALAATGEYDEAMSVYNNANQQAPRIDLEINAALLEYRYRDTDGARKKLEQIYDRYLDSTEDYSSKALIAIGDAVHLLSGKDSSLAPKALEIYEQAIAADSDNPAAHVAIGNLLLDRYNNTEASQAFYDALKIEPLYAPALLGVARSQHFDRSTKSMDAVKQALEIQPNLVAARTMLAQLYLEVEDYVSAETEIDKALEVNPNDPGALTMQAAIHYLDDELSDFDRIVQRTRAMAPGYHEMFETLAKVAAQNRRYADAVDFALYAVNLYQHAWRGYALLGINRLRLGDIERGRYSLLAAFGGDPYDLWTKNTLDLLDKLDAYDSARSARFELVAESSELKILAPLVLPLAELAYDVYAAKYNHRVTTPIRIEIYKEHEDFSVRTVGLVGVDILGVSFGPVVALDSPTSGAFNDFNWASVLWHEIAHTFHLDMSRQRVPRWFSEGLAVFEERRGRAGWGNDVSPSFLGAFKQQRLYPVSELNLSFLRPQYEGQVVHAYYQASLLMEMINERHGFDAIVSMLNGFRVSRSANDLLAEVTGLSAAELDTEFNRFVETRYADALASLGTDSATSDTGTESSYQALLSEGIAALSRDDFATAEEKLLRAQGLFDQHAGAGSSYRLLADVYQQQGNLEAAARQLAANIAIDADDLDAHLQLGEIYVELGRDTQAQEVYRRALYIQPFDIDTHDALATLTTRAGDHAGAVDARQAIVDLNPTDPAEAHYQLADALHLAGRRDQAKRHVLSALEFAPMYEEALELLLDLQPTDGRDGTPENPANEAVTPPTEPQSESG